MNRPACSFVRCRTRARRAAAGLGASGKRGLRYFLFHIVYREVLVPRCNATHRRSQLPAPQSSLTHTCLLVTLSNAAWASAMHQHSARYGGTYCITQTQKDKPGKGNSFVLRKALPYNKDFISRTREIYRGKSAWQGLLLVLAVFCRFLRHE